MGCMLLCVFGWGQNPNDRKAQPSLATKKRLKRLIKRFRWNHHDTTSVKSRTLLFIWGKTKLCWGNYHSLLHHSRWSTCAPGALMVFVSWNWCEATVSLIFTTSALWFQPAGGAVPWKSGAVLSFWGTDGCFYFPRQSNPPETGRIGGKYRRFSEPQESHRPNISAVRWPLKWGENKTGH